MNQPPSEANSAINVTAFGLSDIGRVRKNNEDNFVIFNLSTGEDCRAASLCSHSLGRLGTLLLVADGMGGEASGEVASGIVAQNVPHLLHESLKSADQLTPPAFARHLREAI